MKQYQENEHGGFSIGKLSFTNAPDNQHYQLMQDELTRGVAEVVSYVVPEKTVDELRRNAYLAEGVTLEAMVVALFEDRAEGRPGALNALQAKRQAVKSAHPRP